EPQQDAVNRQNASRLFQEGRQTFRFDTFGDEAFWTGSLELNQAIAGAANGGVGPGVSPKTARALGLKGDVDALPDNLPRALAQGRVSLDDPATTIKLTKMKAVVGVQGSSSGPGKRGSVGITCALCHSQVDTSFAAGIGHRLDGWPNRDL